MENYYVTVGAVEHPVLKTVSWVWRLHHTMTENPILQSPLFSEHSEAIRLADKFSESFKIRFVRPPSPKKEFKIIRGGLYEGEGADL